MLGSSAASLPLRRAPLAFGLCLLAILFAIEAKTAWYGPTVGLGSDIRAAKALPEGMPRLVEHGVSVLGLAYARVAFAYLLQAQARGFLSQLSPRAARSCATIFRFSLQLISFPSSSSALLPFSSVLFPRLHSAFPFVN